MLSINVSRYFKNKRMVLNNTNYRIQSASEACELFIPLSTNRCIDLKRLQSIFIFASDDIGANRPAIVITI